MIAIECLRMFEPDVYKSIASSKDLLISAHSNQNARDQANQEITIILEKATKERRESVEEILKQIFPPIESLFGGYSYGSEFAETWFKELRVCHPDIFPRYFQFAIPVGDISQSDLDEIIHLSQDRNGLVNKLKSLEEAGLLKAALSQLDSYKQDIPLEYSDSFIPALMDIGDTTENESGGFSGFSAHLHLVRIVLWYLRQEQFIERRGEMLLSGFMKTDGLSVMASIISGEQSRREKEEKADLLLTDEPTFTKAKQEFVAKIQGLAESEPKKLLANIHLAGLLFRWKEWGEIKDIRTWLLKNVCSFEDLIALLEKFTSRIVSQGMGDFVAHIKYGIKLGSVETFFPLECVNELIEKGDIENLDERQKQVLDALNSAIMRREKGYADDAWDDD